MRFDRKLINACWVALAVLASGCERDASNGPVDTGPNTPGPHGDIIGDPSLNGVARAPLYLLSGSIRSHGGYAQFNQAVQQEHADALYDLGTALGVELTRTVARRTEVFKACATNADTGDDSSSTSSSRGRRAPRRT